MVRKFVLGFSILLFMIAGFITFLAVKGSVPENFLVEDLNVHVEQRENTKDLIRAEDLSRVVRKKELSRSSVSGLEGKFDGFKGELQDAREPPEALKQFQSGVHAELAKHAEEGKKDQFQINNLQNRVATVQERTAGRIVASGSSTSDGSSKEIVVTLGDELFATGRDAISLKMKDMLEQKAEQIKAMPGYRISVEGHTDNIPLKPALSIRYSDNTGLSYRRAMSVAARLIESGVDPKRITVKGYGETRPLASNETPAGRARNRRVEIRLIKE